ncbi:hybrid sensor histidine kinase/response regulator [Paludibaculum fermentans]|uniref:hybrid sensor histidine kinase/response regulator n=1 Tax=Paludibaculum fermentans TaxID=1473598 RepID=UPI003EB7B653
MKIHWPVPIEDSVLALRQRVEMLGYVSIAGGLTAPPDETLPVLHMAYPRGPLEHALAAVRALRQVLAPDAVMLATGEWVDPAEIGQLFAAGADDYVSLNCETRELAVRLLALKERLEKRTQQSLDQRLRRAQRLETLGTLAGALAHNYNNLLAAIQGNAQLAMMDRTLPETLRYGLTQIDRVSQRAGDLTKQMLAYARNQEGAPRQALNLNLIVQEMSELVRVSVPEGWSVKSGLARNIPPLLGRASELRQLVLNLAWGACGGLGEEGGELRLRTVFDEEAAEPVVVLETEAVGLAGRPGPEVQSEAAELRLTVSRSIAESHGGALEVLERPDGGVMLRALIPPIAGWRMVTPARSMQQSAIARPATVLLVEDEPAVRDMAEKLLRRAGYTVFSADNAAEAWGLCEQVGAALDVVILDLHVPGMRAKEMVHGIRSMFPKMKIVIWSGLEEEAARAKLAGAEPYHFLPKQPKVAEFVAALNELLQSANEA